MTSPILILDPHVRNRIAAGEVIERPASVVKELVENALDAHATSVTVEVREGGRDGIRVTDDGDGIDADQVLTALERHATSKIRNADDLDHITTMGFRGEALPSIASVTRFSLASRPAGADAGQEAVTEGGSSPVVRAIGMAKGTTVTAESLFFNTPARRKFLKAPSTELNYITQAVMAVALARTDVMFTLTSNGAEVLRLPACTDVAQRILQVFGRRVASNLLKAEGERGGLKLTVHAAKPVVARGNSRNIWSFVNGRLFRGKEVIHAVREGFRRFMPADKWPFAILYLEADPGLVDVNVHPSKTEVRFREGGLIHSLVRTCVTEMLRSADITAAYETRDDAPEPAADDRVFPRPEPEGMFTAHEAAPAVPFLTESPIPSFRRPEPRLTPAPTRGGVPRFFQVHDAYLVVELADRVRIFDQHALHEGILEEKIRTAFTAQGLDSQELLIPEQVELAPPDKQALLAMADTLQRFGFEIQDFGGATVVIHAVPVMLDTSRIGPFIEDILGAGGENGPGRDAIADRLLRRIINRIACHSAVRAGQRLADEEIAALLSEAERYPDSATCAHGRPSCFDITRSDLEKRFERT